MKLFLLSAFGMVVAVSAAEPKPAESGLEQQLQKLQELMDQRAAILNESAIERASSDTVVIPTPQVPKSSSPAGRLRMSSLGSVSLQTASGLHSGARGLTSEAEWRRIFPHKPGYSR